VSGSYGSSVPSGSGAAGRRAFRTSKADPLAEDGKLEADANWLAAPDSSIVKAVDNNKCHKAFILSFLMSTLLLIFAIRTNIARQKTTSQSKDVVTFCQVPLVCTVSPNIGCDSMAKSVLLGLGKLPDVKEA
jgi:hypothetical protein